VNAAGKLSEQQSLKRKSKKLKREKTFLLSFSDKHLFDAQIQETHFL